MFSKGVPPTMPFPADNVLVGCNAHPAFWPVKGVDQEPHLLTHPRRIALLQRVLHVNPHQKGQHLATLARDSCREMATSSIVPFCTG